eukprot:TRINITY_DN45112_c0_g1_i1.p1 TRINITY_DN45112_c0_g1~~TRINITY_DN45112_c0_g1_i1.p1  ORF type:complete len:278 (-),score=61.34 TRINITY_DN45112_c0_g1_i1:96-929(-)
MQGNPRNNSLPGQPWQLQHNNGVSPHQMIPPMSMQLSSQQHQFRPVQFMGSGSPLMPTSPPATVSPLGFRYFKSLRGPELLSMYPSLNEPQLERALAEAWTELPPTQKMRLDQEARDTAQQQQQMRGQGNVWGHMQSPSTQQFVGQPPPAERENVSQDVSPLEMAEEDGAGQYMEEDEDSVDDSSSTDSNSERESEDGSSPNSSDNEDSDNDNTDIAPQASPSSLKPWEQLWQQGQNRTEGQVMPIGTKRPKRKRWKSPYSALIPCLLYTSPSPRDS